MLSWLFGPTSAAGADLYVDLGTANTLIAIRGKGIVLNEPSQVMVSETNPKKRKILGIGLEGVEVFKKNPGHILTIKPVKDGVIADFDATKMMMKYFIAKVLKETKLSRPRIVVSLPYGVTEVEKKALMNKLIGVAILFAIYKFVPSQQVRAMALGVGGVMAAAYIPYLNGKSVGGA